MKDKIEIDFGMKISDDLRENWRTGILYTEEDFKGIEYDTTDIQLARTDKAKNTFQKTKGRNAKPFLVLWDIENISFEDDRIIIESMLKRNGIRYAMKFIAYHIRMDRQLPFWLLQYGDNTEWRKIQLRRLGWMLEEKRDADKQLKKLYYQFVDRIGGVVIISADSDFAEIAEDSLSKGLKTHLFFDLKKPRWVENIHGLNIHQLRKEIA